MRSQNLGKILFFSYLIILIWILLFKFSVSFDEIINMYNLQVRSINLIPFQESVIVNNRIDLSEIINNIVVFIPFGGLIGMISKKTSFLIDVLIIALFTISIESLQFILGLGASDITDIITNLTGGIIGLLFYQILKLTFPENRLDKTLIILGAIIFLVCVSLVLLLIIVN